MIRSKVGRTSGILNPSAIAAKFQLSRHLPAQDLRYFVQHYWVARWDLRDQAPYQQETLLYPVVHLVIEHDKSRIVGVIKGKFSTLLHKDFKMIVGRTPAEYARSIGSEL